MTGLVFDEVFNNFKDALVNKKKPDKDFNHYCNWTGMSGGKGQPIKPETVVGSFTGITAVATLKALNHPKSVNRQGRYFSFVSAKKR